MQMGRWFGYRPGYADLCRLYTSPELVKWYRHIAAATAELREEFDLVIDRRRYAARVRQSRPSASRRTAHHRCKQDASGQRVRAGFSGTISETVRSTTQRQPNGKTFADFVDWPPERHGIERPLRMERSGRQQTSHRCWPRSKRRGNSWKANSRAMADYIGERVADGCADANGRSCWSPTDNRRQR